MANPITPETRVHLLSVPLEYNMKDTLWFSNATNQYDYFYSKRIKSNVDFTYQRKDKTMVVPYLVDDIYSCNYVMYQNHNFNNKWFYAFITKMEYVDEETSRLYIDTDPVQTWFFDITMKQSFVEREHTSNDTIGANTIPEGLELGDYVVNNDNRFLGLSFLNYILGTTVDPNAEHPENPSAKITGTTYNGIPSGVAYYCYTDPGDLYDAIENVMKVDDAIKEIFVVPSALMVNQVGSMHEVLSSNTPTQIGEILNIVPVTTINGYTPRNRKLFCYPFNFIKITNNQGQEGILKPELYSKNNNGDYELKILGAITPGCSIRMFPLNYNGKANAIEDGINLAKYPICNWATDPYVNWLTENGLTNTLTTAGGIATAMAGLTAVNTGGLSLLAGLGLSAGGIGATVNSLHQMYVANIQPPQVTGNTNCGDVMTSMGENTFHTMKMSIKAEMARVIDNFFDMYGYQTNRVKVPNSNHRTNYWYTKTIDCNIIGDIPEEDMERIKKCYNDGITFWKNPANMYNYSVSNSIT